MRRSGRPTDRTTLCSPSSKPPTRGPGRGQGAPPARVRPRPPPRAGAPLPPQERIRRDRLLGLADGERPPGRRGGALGAAGARADDAGGADRRHLGPRQVDAVGIADPRGKAGVAAEADGERAVLARIEPHRAFDGAADGEEALAVGRLDHLGDDPPGVWKVACRFQRGQVPPKREKGSSPAKRLEMFPAASTRSMKKGTPLAPSGRAWSAGGRPARRWRRTRRRAGRCRSGAAPPPRGRAGRASGSRRRHDWPGSCAGGAGSARRAAPPRRASAAAAAGTPAGRPGRRAKVRLSARSSDDSISRLRCRS